MKTDAGTDVGEAMMDTALPMLFRALDRLTLDDATQTNSYAGPRLSELRLVLATIAGSLGFVGPDAIEQLRTFVNTKGVKRLVR